MKRNTNIDQKKSTQPKKKYNRAQNFYLRNKHANNPIAHTLKKHLEWCTNPNHKAYPNYGGIGRRVAKELTYTSHGPTNEAMIERVIERIGEKPKPYHKYHLHVDWDATGGVMTLDNISWVYIDENLRDKSTTLRTTDGGFLCEEARAVGLDPVTARARYRRGKSIKQALDPQLRPDIDFKKQRKKHESIFKLIKDGSIFVTRAGELFIIPEFGAPYSRKTKVENNGYHSVTLMLNGQNTRVQFSHVVLLQYAGLPPENDNVTFTVWNADHIDGNKCNNTPSNLCWLPVTINTGVKKAGKDATNNLDYVRLLAERGLAILSGASLSPHPDNIVEVRRQEGTSHMVKLDSWKDCVQFDWLSRPNQELDLLTSEINGIPKDLLERFLLAPGNHAQISGNRASIQCNTTGRRYQLAELSWSCRRLFRFVVFTKDVVDYLKANYPLDEVEHIIAEIPENMMFEKHPISLRGFYRARQSNAESTADYFAHDFIKSQLSSTLLCRYPEIISSLYRNPQNPTPNPLALNIGSSEQTLSVRCAVCNYPTEFVTVKSIVRSDRHGGGRICARCSAKSRARNGLAIH